MLIKFERFFAHLNVSTFAYGWLFLNILSSVTRLSSIPYSTHQRPLSTTAHPCSPLVRVTSMLPYNVLTPTVCAVASRYHKAKTKIYPIAMHFAEHAAVKAFIAGYKSVELAQTFIILSSYGRRTRFWEDRSLLYTKAAIRCVPIAQLVHPSDYQFWLCRIATDLDLHHFPSVKPVDEMQERHIMNRTRVWINCYNLDHSTAAHFGRPSTINEDS